MTAGYPAVFLDRDGVLNRDHGYVYRVADLEILPGVVAGLCALKAAGFLLVMITNQSGIARGKFSRAQAQEFNEELVRRIVEAGGPVLDGVYMCPHFPGAAVTEYALRCDCRKPAPGMLLRAAEEMNIDISRSYMIGDKPSDVEAGTNAGVRSSLLVVNPSDDSLDVVAVRVANLQAAAEKIISASALSSS